MSEPARPNFFILGAPKCGTTSLADWIAQHPQAFVSAQKEPHHFYDPYGPRMPRSRYEALFAGSGDDHLAIGEASIWYLFSGTAVPEILAYQPAARFIVCVRDPTTMALSLHAQKRFTGHEEFERFEDAWRASPARRRGERIGIQGIPEGEAEHMDYAGACRLGTQLERLLSQVDRERVHVVVVDDMRADPARVYRELIEFLELPAGFEADFAVRNRASRRRSFGLHRLLLMLARLKSVLGLKGSTGAFAWLHRANTVEEPYGRPRDEVMEEVRATFAPEVALLERLLERDLSSWRAA